jgi:hypothetical protein
VFQRELFKVQYCPVCHWEGRFGIFDPDIAHSYNGFVLLLCTIPAFLVSNMAVEWMVATMTNLR